MIWKLNSDHRSFTMAWHLFWFGLGCLTWYFNSFRPTISCWINFFGPIYIFPGSISPDNKVSGNVISHFQTLASSEALPASSAGEGWIIRETQTYNQFWGSCWEAGTVGNCPRSLRAAPGERRPCRLYTTTERFRRVPPSGRATRRKPEKKRNAAPMSKVSFSNQVSIYFCPIVCKAVNQISNTCRFTFTNFFVYFQNWIKYKADTMTFILICNCDYWDWLAIKPS